VAYTAAQAARLSGCSLSQLRHWARTGLVPASEDDGQYSFRDLVSLRVVRSLLDTGLASSRVRAAVQWLRESGEELASLRLVTDGRHVWACHDDGQILDALRAGQLALFVAVDKVAAQVASEVQTFTAERAEFVDRLVQPG
jgi:DNA-binding transcriptional MerR regulator